MARVAMSCEDYTREYSIDEDVIIGRGESCDIKVPSIKASREHCRIFKGTGGYFLEDLGSANGTVLNGKMIGRKLLKHNDEITVGRVRLRFIDKTEDQLIGKRLGRYQILEKIGVGAEGTIYHGYQVALNRNVAIKLLKNEYIQRKGGIESIRAGMETAQCFEHENVVNIFEFVEEKGRCFYAMELIAGENLLDKTIRKRKIKVAEVIEYGLSLCSALNALHAHGVLHGDIKPQNIIIDNQNCLKLLDLGWIKINKNELVVKNGDEEDTEADTEESKYSKQVFATPQYVAPELINHKPQCEQSDVYAMAVTLYQLLTGELPYKATRIDELLKQHIVGDAKNPCEINSKIPDKLGALIIRAMEYDPEKRVKSAEEFYNELLVIKEELDKKKQKDKEMLLKRLRQKKFGTIKIGVPYKILALLVFILLGVSYGFRQYKEYSLARQKTVAERLELGEELYKEGEYEKAENVIREVLAENSNAEIEEKANKLLSLLVLPQAVKELYVLQKKLDAGEITKIKLIEVLRERLRSGTLDMNEAKEYAAYLTSIGGDSDIRYDWQKQIDQELLNNNLLSAYALISNYGMTNTDKEERKVFDVYSANLTNKLNTLIRKEYAEAGELLNKGNTADAADLLSSIVNKYPQSLGWQKQILEYFAKSNEDVASKVIAAFGKALGAISELDNAGLREGLFQLEEFTSKSVSKIDANTIMLLPEYISAFEGALIKRIQEAYESEPGKAERVEVSIDAKREFVRLNYEKGKLLAYAQESRFEIEFADVAVSSIEKIMPVFAITPEEAVGAGIYFIARGEERIGRGYLEAIRGAGAKAISDNAEQYLRLSNGVAVIPLAGLNKKDGVILAESCIKIGGSSIIMPVADSEYIFALAAGGELVLRISGSELVVLQKNSGKESVLGRAVVLAQEGGYLEVKGYWDKLLISQNEIMVGSVESEAIGNIILAPVYEAGAGKLKMQVNIPVEKRPEPEKDKIEVLG